MTNKKQRTIWTIKVQKDGETIHSRRSAVYGRIRRSLQYHFDQDGVSMTIVANYGKHADCWGDLVTFKNEGTYDDFPSALLALEMFKEVADEWKAEAVENHTKEIQK